LKRRAALAPEALQQWLVSKEFHMSKVVKARPAIARNDSAVPPHLDHMGSNAGYRAGTSGLVAVDADPDDAVT
jgi:hypothetical protein